MRNFFKLSVGIYAIITAFLLMGTSNTALAQSETCALATGTSSADGVWRTANGVNIGTVNELGNAGTCDAAATSELDTWWRFTTDATHTSYIIYVQGFPDLVNINNSTGDYRPAVELRTDAACPGAVVGTYCTVATNGGGLAAMYVTGLTVNTFYKIRVWHNHNSLPVTSDFRFKISPARKWIGSATGGAWSTASNWEGSAVPSSTEDAYILAGTSAMTFTGTTTTVAGVFVDGTTGSVTWSTTGQTLTASTGFSSFVNVSLGGLALTIPQGYSYFSKTLTTGSQAPSLNITGTSTNYIFFGGSAGTLALGGTGNVQVTSASVNNTNIVFLSDMATSPITIASTGFIKFTDRNSNLYFCPDSRTQTTPIAKTGVARNWTLPTGCFGTSSTQTIVVPATGGSSGAYTITMSSTNAAKINRGMAISGTGIAPGARIISAGATTTLSLPNTGTVSGNLTISGIGLNILGTKPTGPGSILGSTFCGQVTLPSDCPDMIVAASINVSSLFALGGGNLLMPGSSSGAVNGTYTGFVTSSTSGYIICATATAGTPAFNIGSSRALITTDAAATPTVSQRLTASPLGAISAIATAGRVFGFKMVDGCPPGIGTSSNYITRYYVTWDPNANDGPTPSSGTYTSAASTFTFLGSATTGCTFSTTADAVGTATGIPVMIGNGTTYAAVGSNVTTATTFATAAGSQATYPLGGANSNTIAAFVGLPTTLYWIGTTNGTGSWTTGTNWSGSLGGATCNCTPQAGNTVIIDNNASNSAFTINNVDASVYAAVTTQGSGSGTVTLTGSSVDFNPGTLTINANTTLTFSTNKVVISGSTSAVGASKTLTTTQLHVGYTPSTGTLFTVNGTLNIFSNANGQGLYTGGPSYLVVGNGGTLNVQGSGSTYTLYPLTVNYANGSSYGTINFTGSGYWSPTTVGGGYPIINGKLTLQGVTYFNTGFLNWGANSMLEYLQTSSVNATSVEWPAGPSNTPKTILMNCGANTITTTGTDRTYSGTLTMTAGFLQLGTRNLTLSTPSVMTGANASSYIVTNGAGALTVNSVTTSGYTFPVGSAASDYTPLTVTPSGTTNLTVGVNALSLSVANATQCVQKEWSVIAGTGGITATVAPAWNSGSPDEGASFNNAAACDFGVWDGTAWTTSNVGTPTGTYTVSKSSLSIPTSGTNKYVVGNTGAIASSCTNPTISIDLTAPSICNGGSGVDITASCSANCDGIAYAWAPATGLSATTGATVTANPTTTTTYTVTATVTGGCTSTATSIVTVNNVPSSPTAGSNSAVCEGSDLNLTSSATEGASYSWSGPNIFSSLLQNPTITGATTAASGTYSVTISNTCGSTSTTTNVTVNSLPSSAGGLANQSVCGNGNVTFTVTDPGAGFTVEWSTNGTSNNDGTGAGGSGDLTKQKAVTVGSPITEYARISNNTTLCKSAWVSATGTANTLPNSASGLTNQTICSNGNVTFTVTDPGAGYTVEWSTNGTGNDDGTAAGGSGNVTIVKAVTLGSPITEYARISNDATGCKSSAWVSATGTVLTAPSAPTAGSNSPICSGSNLNLTSSVGAGNPAPTYSWSGPNSFSSSSQNPTITAATTAATGTYTVTATNSCGSTSTTTSVTVNARPGVPSVGTITQPSCNTATASVALSGLPAGSWTVTGSPSGSATGSGTTGNVSGLTANTTYTFTVNDGTCTSTASGNAVVNAQPTAPSSQATIGGYTNNTTGNSITVNWSRGNGGSVIVVAKLTSTTGVDPVSETSYTANAAFGSGNTTGTDNYVVYSGTGTTVNVTALTAGTSYTFTVYEVSSSGSCYKTPGSASAVVTYTPPIVVLADNGTQVGTGNINPGIEHSILLKSQLTAYTIDATVTQVTFSTSGSTYQSSDVQEYTLWYQTTSAFNAATASRVWSNIFPGGPGTITCSSLNITITAGTTGYFFLTATTKPCAVIGRYIKVNAQTTSNYTFSAGGTPQGSTTASGNQTFATQVNYYTVSQYGYCNGTSVSAFPFQITGAPPYKYQNNSAIYQRGATNGIPSCMPAGAINDISFATTQLCGSSNSRNLVGNVKIWMKNTSATTYAGTVNFATQQSSMTKVFDQSVNLSLGADGYFTFNGLSGFTYDGSSNLEVAIEFCGLSTLTFSGNWAITSHTDQNYSVVSRTSCGTEATAFTASRAITRFGITPCSVPTITTSGTLTAVCYNAGSQTTSMSYSASTNSPTSYSIDWDATANSAGLADQGSTAFSFIAVGGTLTGISITAGTPAGSYSGTMTIAADGGCTSTQAVSLTVNSFPSVNITETDNSGTANDGAVCTGGSATLTASGATTYSWNTGATTSSITVTPGSTTTYTVTGTTGCSATATSTISVANCDFNFTVKFFIQGYYLGGNKLSPLLHLLGATSATAVDTATIELHDANSPYSLLYTFTGIVTTDGNLVCTFPASASGSTYRIAVKHRNILETWSASGVSVSSGGSYDFTTGAGQAYGSSMVSLGGGKYGFYSGDINQNGTINTADKTALQNVLPSFIIGQYNVNDLTGDGFVDEDDYRILENNVPLNISVQQHP